MYVQTEMYRKGQVMQAQAYEGYFEGGKFYTGGQLLRIPERKLVS